MKLNSPLGLFFFARSRCLSWFRYNHIRGRLGDPEMSKLMLSWKFFDSYRHYNQPVYSLVLDAPVRCIDLPSHSDKFRVIFIANNSWKLFCRLSMGLR